ncbi:MAG: hydroxyacid dehydrogenase [Legionellales bacterium]|nr:hydroxyacid dehydrogenase [Legionellales bacterium]|tara:strand:- start:12050 stop:13096 length:1047 start_codon:yes stop_codon:yes gene_type:complete
MSQVAAYAAPSATDDLAPLTIERRDVGPNDIQIDIEYCGVCHSDIHVARNEWKNTIYPTVPGHEIIGRVSSIGNDVEGFETGDLVGVGCLVDSCRQCHHCEEHLEQYCSDKLLTYNSEDPQLGGPTFGGYSKQVVVDKDFVLRIPSNLDRKAVAPLLCAGITTYSPLKHWNIKPGDKVGIIGLGGLGHMGVKFAHALGAEVTMITTSPTKGEDAMTLGADKVLISKDADAMTAHTDYFDFLLNTIPCSHDMNPYVELLQRDGTMVIVGAIEPIEPGINGGPMIFGRKSIAGSLIGGIQETQEMLDFCGEHDIVCDIEMINMADINTAYERMIKGDVKYRFVIDVNNSL